VYVVATAAGSVVDPSYSQVQQHVSDLTGTGAPTQAILAPAYCLYNLLAFGFAVSLYGALGRTRLALIGTLLLAVNSIAGIMMVTIFTEDLGGAPHTVFGYGHVIFAAVSSLAILCAALICGFAFRRRSGWRGLSIFTFLIAAAFVVAAPWAIIATSTNSLVGLAERAAIAPFIVWLLVVGAYALRIGAQSDEGRVTSSLEPSRLDELGIDLCWLPLGAGGQFVRLNGKIYEAIAARLQRRPVLDLYHSALQVYVPEGCYVIEQTPVFDSNGARRGVVGEGPVGARWAGRFRIFRYEIRRWLGGEIPDINEAVDSPRRLSSDPDRARRILRAAPEVPILTWGRDEIGAGEMWNSNSMISWMLEQVDFDASSIKPPAGGRAPGWTAGIVAARAPSVRRNPLSSPATR
jgi:hypothetical membrane protein